MKKWLQFVILLVCVGLCLGGCRKADDKKKDTTTKEQTVSSQEGKQNKLDKDNKQDKDNKEHQRKIVSKENSEKKGEPEIELSVEEQLEQRVTTKVNSMTLEEKVSQLFVVRPESIIAAECVTQAGEITREAIDKYPVAGFIYFADNLTEPEQVKAMTLNVQEFSIQRCGLPMFTCIDEEGGTVARIGSNPNFAVPQINNMSEYGVRASVEEAAQIGQTIGGYLHELGFNVDFAPVADVLSNPANEVVRERSFGTDSQTVANMSYALYQGLESKNVLGVYKHFPGHGGTEGDTHLGYAYNSKTLEELRSCELIPFQNAIAQGADFIMVGHISLPNAAGSDVPATLSASIVNELLRTDMKYDGIVITDAMDMGAIVQNYSSGEAAVTAVQAGIDLILSPQDFYQAYNSILEAVNNGTISVERIDESVRRILKVKFKIIDAGTSFHN